MVPTDTKTWLLYILLTILLGALGTAFWETAFKPVCSALARILLRILTLGRVSATNSIYRDAARRLIHRATLFFYAPLLIALSLLVGYTGAGVHLYALGGITHIEKEVTTTLNEKGPIALKDLGNKQKATLSLAAFVFATVLLIRTSYSHLRNSYVIALITHFDQCLAICLPYIEEHAKRKLLSQFAQIKTANDYFEVIQQLRTVAEQNNIELPTMVVL